MLDGRIKRLTWTTAVCIAVAVTVGCGRSGAATAETTTSETTTAETSNTETANVGSSIASAETANEAERIVEVLGLEPGHQVADVGAGDGEWTEVLATAVGPIGKVLATEVDEDDLEDLRKLADDSWMRNIQVIEGNDADTGLPADCCDGILLRLVYHHFTDPGLMRASLRQALRPGARLAVIDIVPQEDWRRLEGVPERGGHGIPIDDLVAEMTGDGFEVVERFDDWPDEEDHFCVVFRRAGD